MSSASPAAQSDLRSQGLLLQALAGAAALLDPEGRLCANNARWRIEEFSPELSLLGCESGQLLAPLLAGLPIYNLGPEATDCFKAVSEGKVAASETELVTGAPPSRRFFVLRFSRLSAGGPTLVTLRDESRRIKAEEQLRISRSRLRSVISGAPIVLLGLDLNGVFTVVEGVGASGLGATPELLIGRSVFEVYAHIPPMLDAVKSALHGETVEVAVPIGRMTYELRFSPSFDPDNQVKGLVGVATDVTERTRVEQMKNEFVSIVSHELRTPLTSIRGSLGLLEGGVAGALPERAHDLVRIARANSERLIRLINDILDLDKLEAGRLEFENKEVEVAPLVEQSCQELQGVATEKGIAVVTEIETPDLRVLGDRDRLLQVVINLTSNALKFSPPEGKVVLHVSRRDRRVRVEVRDQGPGIPPDQRQRLFRKFQQLDTPSTKSSGGSGLGLAISKAIVDAHTGRIDVESVLGEGSTFFFEIPEYGSAAAQPARAMAQGIRGRTVEIDVGGVNDLVNVSVPKRFAGLHASVETALGDPDSASLIDAHAQASILLATLPPDTQEEVRAGLREIENQLARLKSAPSETAAATPGLKQSLARVGALLG